MLAPPAAVPHLQTWWWTTQLRASSPTRCSRPTAERTERATRTARAGRSAAVVAVKQRPDLSSARTRCKTWDWRSTAGREKGCTIWTRRWMALEKSCPTHRGLQSASSQRSPRCCSLATTSLCCPALWRRWRSWLGTFTEAVLVSRAAQPHTPPLPRQHPQPTSPCILWPHLCTLWWAARLRLSSITQLLQLRRRPHTLLRQPASWVFMHRSRAS